MSECFTAPSEITIETPQLWFAFTQDSFRVAAKKPAGVALYVTSYLDFNFYKKFPGKNYGTIYRENRDDVGLNLLIGAQ